MPERASRCAQIWSGSRRNDHGRSRFQTSAGTRNVQKFRSRRGPEAVQIDRRQLVGRRLNRFAVGMSLHELGSGNPRGVVRDKNGSLPRFHRPKRWARRVA